MSTCWKLSAAERLSPELPESFYTLAEAFWPGPLTMILPKCLRLPAETTGGLSTVAIRFPDHPVALALIREAGAGDKRLTASSVGYSLAPRINAAGRLGKTRLAEGHHKSGQI